MKTKLKLSDVEIKLECLPEEVPIRGNCSAVDPETDREQQDFKEGGYYNDMVREALYSLNEKYAELIAD